MHRDKGKTSILEKVGAQTELPVLCPCRDSMVRPSFAEKEFEPEFEIALSEDIFDRPLF